MVEPIVVQVVVDAGSPALLADFWAFALGYRLEDPPPGYSSWQELLEASGVPQERWDDASAIIPAQEASGPRVFFQKVPERKQIKNRLHLDVKVGLGIDDAERRWAVVLRHVEGLTHRGAVVVEERAGQWGERWIVMTDPEGNEFCVS